MKKNMANWCNDSDRRISQDSKKKAVPVQRIPRHILFQILSKN